MNIDRKDIALMGTAATILFGGASGCVRNQTIKGSGNFEITTSDNTPTTVNTPTIDAAAQGKKDAMNTALAGQAKPIATATIGEVHYTVTPITRQPTAEPTKKVEPTATATAVEQTCPGEWQIKNSNGRAVVGVSGIPQQVTGNFDLANHGIFTSLLPGMAQGANPLQNVLGEPGAFLADRALIEKTEPQNLGSWDSKVKAGYAEYIRTSGPDVNFFDLQNVTDRGVSLNPETGKYELKLNLSKHLIVRVDAEEANILMKSANGDRNVRINLCQSGSTPGDDFGHQTFFIRTPYEQGSTLVLENPTIPGTQVQILGMEVKDATAFASIESFLQGVEQRQARPDYPGYYAGTFNINDKTLGYTESLRPKAPFKTLKKNY